MTLGLSRKASEPRCAGPRRDATDLARPAARFHRGKASLFLISLKAAGTGLNPTAADSVIHYDPWWKPGGRRPGDRPRPPHWPGQAGVCVQACRARHVEGSGCRNCSSARRRWQEASTKPTAIPPRRLMPRTSSACSSRSAEIEPGENHTEKRFTVLGSGAHFDYRDQARNRMRCIPKTTGTSITSTATGCWWPPILRAASDRPGRGTTR
jgi:hypothetical protein